MLVLFSGPHTDHPPGQVPDDADLLLTVRAGTLRHHAGQAAFPGGAADPGDPGPVHTALREANEETGVDPARLHPLATLDRMFIPPSGFHVVPVLAYSPDPGPVTVVDESETAAVARVPLPRWYWIGLTAGTALGVVFVHWLIYETLYEIGALCPYCMVVWSVTVPLLVVVASIALRPLAANPAAQALYHWRWPLVTLWFTAVLLLILVRFWDYWSTLI